MKDDKLRVLPLQWPDFSRLKLDARTQMFFKFTSIRSNYQCERGWALLVHSAFNASHRRPRKCTNWANPAIRIRNGSKCRKPRRASRSRQSIFVIHFSSSGVATSAIRKIRVSFPLDCFFFYLRNGINEKTTTTTTTRTQANCSESERGRMADSHATLEPSNLFMILMVIVYARERFVFGFPSFLLSSRLALASDFEDDFCRLCWARIRNGMKSISTANAVFFAANGKPDAGKPERKLALKVLPLPLPRFTMLFHALAMLRSQKQRRKEETFVA